MPNPSFQLFSAVKFPCGYPLILKNRENHRLFAVNPVLDCAALYFSKTDGFPTEKPAGIPCRFLSGDFRRVIYHDLAKRKI